MGWLSLLLMLCFVAGASASLQAGPYFVESGHFYIRPTWRIDLSGTGSWYIANSHWLTWGPKGATALTTFCSNTCKPNCAAGRYRTQPARVRLSHLVVCRGKVVFNAFTVSDRAGRGLLSGDFRSIGYLRDC